MGPKETLEQARAGKRKVTNQPSSGPSNPRSSNIGSTRPRVPSTMAFRAMVTTIDLVVEENSRTLCASSTPEPEDTQPGQARQSRQSRQPGQAAVREGSDATPIAPQETDQAANVRIPYTPHTHLPRRFSEDILIQADGPGETVPNILDPTGQFRSWVIKYLVYDRASAVDPVDVMYAWSAYLEHNSESLRSHGWTQAPSVHEITSLVSSIIPLAREVNAGGEDLTIHGVMWAALENESGAGDGSIRAGRWSSNYMSDMLIDPQSYDEFDATRAMLEVDRVRMFLTTGFKPGPSETVHAESIWEYYLELCKRSRRPFPPVDVQTFWNVFYEVFPSITEPVTVSPDHIVLKGLTVEEGMHAGDGVKAFNSWHQRRVERYVQWGLIDRSSLKRPLTKFWWEFTRGAFLARPPRIRPFEVGPCKTEKAAKAKTKAEAGAASAKHSTKPKPSTKPRPSNNTMATSRNSLPSTQDVEDGTPKIDQEPLKAKVAVLVMNVGAMKAGVVDMEDMESREELENGVRMTLGELEGPGLEEQKVELQRAMEDLEALRKGEMSAATKTAAGPPDTNAPVKNPFDDPVASKPDPVVKKRKVKVLVSMVDAMKNAAAEGQELMTAERMKDIQKTMRELFEEIEGLGMDEERRILGRSIRDLEVIQEGKTPPAQPSEDCIAKVRKMIPSVMWGQAGIGTIDPNTFGTNVKDMGILIKALKNTYTNGTAPTLSDEVRPAMEVVLRQLLRHTSGMNLEDERTMLRVAIKDLQDIRQMLSEDSVPLELTLPGASRPALTRAMDEAMAKVRELFPSALTQQDGILYFNLDALRSDIAKTARTVEGLKISHDNGSKLNMSAQIRIPLEALMRQIQAQTESLELGKERAMLKRTIVDLEAIRQGEMERATVQFQTGTSGAEWTDDKMGPALQAFVSAQQSGHEVGFDVKEMRKALVKRVADGAELARAMRIASNFSAGLPMDVEERAKWENTMKQMEVQLALSGLDGERKVLMGALKDMEAIRQGDSGTARPEAFELEERADVMEHIRLTTTSVEVAANPVMIAKSSKTAHAMRDALANGRPLLLNGETRVTWLSALRYQEAHIAESATAEDKALLRGTIEDMEELRKGLLAEALTWIEPAPSDKATYDDADNAQLLSRWGITSEVLATMNAEAQILMADAVRKLENYLSGVPEEQTVQAAKLAQRMMNDLPEHRKATWAMHKECVEDIIISLEEHVNVKVAPLHREAAVEDDDEEAMRLFRAIPFPHLDKVSITVEQKAVTTFAMQKLRITAMSLRGDARKDAIELTRKMISEAPASRKSTWQGQKGLFEEITKHLEAPVNLNAVQLAIQKLSMDAAEKKQPMQTKLSSKKDSSTKNSKSKDSKSKDSKPKDADPKNTKDSSTTDDNSAEAGSCKPAAKQNSNKTPNKKGSGKKDKRGRGKGW